MKRKNMIVTLVTFTMLLFLQACSTTYPHLQTVSKVDPHKYIGRWYEIARYDQFFERGCSNISATYTLREDKKIDLVNRCTLDDGTQKSAKGIAYAVDESFSKLKVSFFRPFYGDYQIIMLDEAYSYAVIGEPSREYFWILSRTKKLDPKTQNMILSKMKSFGYDPAKLIWPTHDE